MVLIFSMMVMLCLSETLINLGMSAYRRLRAPRFRSFRARQYRFN